MQISSLIVIYAVGSSVRNERLLILVSFWEWQPCNYIHGEVNTWLDDF